MKKTVFLVGLACTMMAMTPIHAADDETKDVEITDDTATQDGTVWGQLTADETLKQLKATLPIKIDFVVMPKVTPTAGTAPAAANVVVNGDYKIQVANDSEVGIKLDSVKLTKIGAWELKTKTEVATLTDVGTDTKIDTLRRTVNLDLLGKELKIGDNDLSALKFKVDVTDSKSLEIKGTAGKVNLFGIPVEEASKAFTITYTISQDKIK